jgi:type II secretory pathway pseudopilin PulG
MNKKAITLVEVIVSVVLISVVITVLLQIKNNSLNFLQIGKNKLLYGSYIDMIAIATKYDKLKDENIYLSSKIDLSKLKDDNLRKRLKKIKIKIKEKILSPIIFDDKYHFIINIKQTKMEITNKISKIFYTFLIELK